jgi:hypothetical protein
MAGVYCYVCARPLDTTEQDAWDRLCEVEPAAAATPCVCPTCSGLGLDPSDDVDHIHLFHDQNRN